jgi:hypothetical protein
MESVALIYIYHKFFKPELYNGYTEKGEDFRRKPNQSDITDIGFRRPPRFFRVEHT